MNRVDDEQYDACVECGCEDFYTDECMWERSCTSCGLTSCIEWSMYESPMDRKYYKKDAYMFNTVISNAIKLGAPINQQDMETLIIMFKESVRMFNQVKSKMNRKNYPSYQYTLLQLGYSMGKDLTPYVKLPKLRSTLDKVKQDWHFINPLHH